MKKFHVQRTTLAMLLGSTVIAFMGSVATHAATPNATRMLIAQTDFTNFFEGGRLRSEDRLNFKRPPSPTIPVNSASQYWQPVVLRAGRCSLWMPPGILTEESVVLNTSAGKLNFRTLASNATDNRYVVAYADQLTKTQVQDAQVLLQAIRDRVAPAKQYQLRQERQITLNNKYPGRELIFQGKNDMLAMRTYLVDRRVYAIGARYTADTTSNQQISGFLSSFQLLNP